MKKTVWLLIGILLFAAALNGASAQSARTEIDTPAALLRMADNPSGDYVLTADIDLSGIDWTPFAFSGRLDGAGHTIANLTVRGVGEKTAVVYDGNYKEYEAALAGLFSAAENAEICDLKLLNADLRVETDRCCFLGAIAGYAAYTTVRNCTVTMRGHLALTSQCAGVGGLVGFSYDCTMNGCTTDAELVYTDRNPDVLCEEFLGGVYACGFGTVSGCTVTLRGYAEIYGYAHNGGVIGMFKLSKPKPKGPRYLRDATVDAEIHFFEITPSRRAYCKALIGEDNVGACHVSHNHEVRFVRAESREAAPQRPEACDTPDYAALVTEPTCTEWGCTVFTCRKCGYTYTDRLTPPQHHYTAAVTPPTCTDAGETVYTCMGCGDTYTEPIAPTGHVPGAWTVVWDAAIGQDGLEELRCAVCGERLETRAIAAMQPIRAETVTPNVTAYSLHPDETAVLTAAVLPADATDRGVIFHSADARIASVDANGRITAHDEGVTEIIIESADGYARAVCTVTVTRTFAQKLARLFSFSWLRCAGE